MRRWPVTLRLLAGSLVGLLAVAAVGLVSVVVIARQRAAMDSLALLSRTQRILQDADMEHDVVLADVLAIDNTWDEIRSPEQLQQQLERDIDTYRKYLMSAESMPLPADLRIAIANAEPDLDAFLNGATGLANRAEQHGTITTSDGAQFQQTFDRLSNTNRRLTDLFASRVSSADTEADAAARSAIWAIVLTGLAAVVIVGAVGRMVTTSIAHALGGVRTAAEAIADGDLSVRSEVLVADDIGAVAGAVAMADALQHMIAACRPSRSRMSSAGSSLRSLTWPTPRPMPTSWWHGR